MYVLIVRTRTVEEPQSKTENHDTKQDTKQDVKQAPTPVEETVKRLSNERDALEHQARMLCDQNNTLKARLEENVQTLEALQRLFHDRESRDKSTIEQLKQEREELLARQQALCDRLGEQARFTFAQEYETKKYRHLYTQLKAEVDKQQGKHEGNA